MAALPLRALAVAFAVLASHGALAAAEIVSADIDHRFPAREAITLPGKFVAGKTVRDSQGEHAILLSRRLGPSHENPGGDADERIELNASYHTRKGGSWVRTWLVHDRVDCPHLDVEARFIPGALTVTDLDGNGVAEVTMAYTMFCGGGVDASDLKIILRQGAQKFAMRGRTLLKAPGMAPFGGEARYDAALSRPEYARFKVHLQRLRSQVVEEK